MIPERKEYEQRERDMHGAALAEIERAPLVERKEARAEWAEAIVKYPSLVAQRIGWILEGCYGWGAYESAWRIVKATRMNRVSALSQLVAALEWRCPSEYARGAWKSTTPESQRKLDALIIAEIEAQEKAQEKAQEEQGKV